MAAGTPSLTAPLWLARLWLLTASVSALAVPVILALQPHWHIARVHLAQLGVWQAWISIAACLGLLLLSRKKHTQSEEPWAQGALLIFVLGGLLSAILLNYGVLPQWLARSSSLALSVQIIAVMLLHWCCAWHTWRRLRQFSRQR